MSLLFLYYFHSNLTLPFKKIYIFRIFHCVPKVHYILLIMNFWHYTIINAEKRLILSLFLFLLQYYYYYLVLNEGIRGCGSLLWLLSCVPRFKYIFLECFFIWMLYCHNLYSYFDSTHFKLTKLGVVQQ